MRIIGVTGPSGSGKTTLVNKMSKKLTELGGRVLIISQDDYFKQIADYVRRADGEIDFEHPDNTLWRELVETLSNLKEGKSATVPIYRKGLGPDDGRQGLRQVGCNYDLVLVEGFTLFYDERVRKMFKREDTLALVVGENVARGRRREAYAQYGDLPEKFHEQAWAAYEKYGRRSAEWVYHKVTAVMGKEWVLEKSLAVLGLTD